MSFSSLSRAKRVYVGRMCSCHDTRWQHVMCTRRVVAEIYLNQENEIVYYRSVFLTKYTKNRMQSLLCDQHSLLYIIMCVRRLSFHLQKEYVKLSLLRMCFDNLRLHVSSFSSFFIVLSRFTDIIKNISIIRAYNLTYSSRDCIAYNYRKQCFSHSVDTKLYRESG